MPKFDLRKFQTKNMKNQTPPKKKKKIRTTIFLALSEKMIFLFTDMILFFRWKTEDHFLNKIHRNMKTSVYLVKMVFLFPANKIPPFCLKSKNDLLPKTHMKMTFLVSLISKKMIFILENIVLLLTGKLKTIKTFTQTNTRWQNQCD